MYWEKSSTPVPSSSRSTAASSAITMRMAGMVSRPPAPEGVSRVQGEFDLHRGRAARRAVDPNAAVDRADALGEARQARTRAERGTAAAVVGHPQPQSLVPL